MERDKADGAYAYLALACAITWALDLPLALAWRRHLTPAPYAVALAGLGALGPTLAAFAIAAPRRELGQVFGRWRTNPLWIIAALLTAPALHLVATLAEVTLGGQPAQWFYPPVKPEHVAALVMFSVGEEFGWRGFAYPRLAERHGAVIGSVLLGAAWGVWHLMMLVSPEDGSFNVGMLGVHVVDLALYSIVFAWFFERGGRSMAVAIALHAGAHLDNIYRAPPTELRLRLLRFVVLGVAAALAARSLARKQPASSVSALRHERLEPRA